jgi:hypothetical protein
MSEAVTPPVDTGIDTPPSTDGGTQPTADATPPSGLPSEQPTSETFDGFALTDDIKGKFKDGKLNGRFSSLDDVLAKLKEAEDFRANTIREQKEREAGTQNQQQEQVVKQELAQTQAALVQEMLPEFIKNGMQLNDEMIARAEEAKLDIRDLKIEAMEFKERANKAYSIVGGEENYKAMQKWAIETLPEEDRKAFTADVNNAKMSKFAIQGLYAEFEKAQSDGSYSRISGQPTTVGARPYADRRELYKDKEYVESPAGRRDTAAQKMYRTRLRMTPDSVIYGR